MEPLRSSDLVDLLARVRKGDADAWAVLTDHFTGLLWSIARGLRLGDADAADAVQTTWLRLVENLDAIREPERIGGWLATTVRRECLDIQRRSARVRPAEPGGPDGWEGLPSAADPLDAALLRDERDAALWAAFRELKPSCQALLRSLTGDPTPSYAEVAALLGMPIGSVGPNRQRCLGCLRKLLAADTSRQTEADKE
jgi:RNA polymerase sigma factor (sigma-70 family)